MSEDKSKPKALSDDDLDAVQGGGQLSKSSDAASPDLGKGDNKHGKLFDEADSILGRDGSKKIATEAGDGSI